MADSKAMQILSAIKAAINAGKEHIKKVDDELISAEDMYRIYKAEKENPESSTTFPYACICGAPEDEVAIEETMPFIHARLRVAVFIWLVRIENLKIEEEQVIKEVRDIVESEDNAQWEVEGQALADNTYPVSVSRDIPWKTEVASNPVPTALVGIFFDVDYRYMRGQS